MKCTMGDLHSKEVINVNDGRRIGFVSDIQLDTKTAALTAIIVYGRLKLFGLLGREDDILISWREIKLIGNDAVLVNYTGGEIAGKKSLLSTFWEKW